MKFFLNVSKSEQKKRFLKRIELLEKNWKFSVSDAKERAYWDDYMEAYQDVLNHTSTEIAPWYTAHGLKLNFCHAEQSVRALVLRGLAPRTRSRFLSIVKHLGDSSLRTPPGRQATE